MPGTYPVDSAPGADDPKTPRFVADAMVGKLARWLRVLGIDVLYDATLDDQELVDLAGREKRILLTRDNPLARQGDDPPRLLIASDDFRQQLLQVVETYGLSPWRAIFTRCVDCNSLLESVVSEDVRGEVPPYVYSTQSQFKRCPRCNKILWGGTHRQHMLRILEEIFGPTRLPGLASGDGPQA